MATYVVNERAVARARALIDARQYVVVSDWGTEQPRVAAENAFLESHGWEEYAEWHLALTGGATDETKARYAFVYGDFRRVHRSGLIAVGRTNRDVAQELFLSPRTVDMHVRNILRKLDSHSRVEAAHRAGELGLLA